MDTVNKLNYEAQGWHLVGSEAIIEYRSQRVDPNNWLSQQAVNDNGDHAKIWWYMDHPDAEDGGDYVDDWYKCHDIEIVDSDS